jgi:drug/metabolite transporter (DMT)-like permease
MNGYVIAFFAVFLNIVGQLLLKKSVLSEAKSLVSIYINPFTISGYGLLLVSTIFTVIALRSLEVKELVFILPFSYVLVPLFASVIYKEILTKKQITGIVVIFIGVIVYNFDKFLQ